VGRWAMVAAGAVVTKDVADHALVAGCPAQFAGYVCDCGRPLQREGAAWRCSDCGRSYRFEPAHLETR